LQEPLEGVLPICIEGDGLNERGHTASIAAIRCLSKATLGFEGHRDGKGLGLSLAF
jgi:hypothetical protein